MDHLRSLPVKNKSELPVIPVDERAAEVRAIRVGDLGSGQSGSPELSGEAAEYFRKNGCSVQLLPTPQAITVWNAAKGAVIRQSHYDDLGTKFKGQDNAAALLKYLVFIT
jgi:hypothetical protein